MCVDIDGFSFSSTLMFKQAAVLLVKLLMRSLVIDCEVMILHLKANLKKYFFVYH